MIEEAEGDILTMSCRYCSWKKVKPQGRLDDIKSHLENFHRMKEPIIVETTIDELTVPCLSAVNELNTTILAEKTQYIHDIPYQEIFIPELWYCSEHLPNYNTVWHVGPNGRWKREIVETDQKWAFGHPVHLVPVNIFAIPNRPLTLPTFELSLKTLNKRDLIYRFFTFIFNMKTLRLSPII
jgi:hypothetical protein